MFLSSMAYTIVAAMASRMFYSQTADFSTEWILKTKLKSEEYKRCYYIRYI